MAEGIITRGPKAFAALAAAISVLALSVTAAGAADLKWSFEKVGEGIKPAIALDADGTPHITYLTEAMRGAAFYTTNKSGEWKTEKLAEGYFYGPIDIDVTSGGEPYITYHDHQATGFNPRLGAGVVAARNAGAWELTTIKDRGQPRGSLTHSTSSPELHPMFTSPSGSCHTSTIRRASTSSLERSMISDTTLLGSCSSVRGQVAKRPTSN